MRILHTSDWHLGRDLAGFSRSREHESFLDELVKLADDVDIVIISGDVFDTFNPPVAAEELYFDALARLGDGARRAVVVIAGNPASPDGLTAPGIVELGPCSGAASPGCKASTPRACAKAGAVNAAIIAPNAAMCVLLIMLYSSFSVASVSSRPSPSSRRRPRPVKTSRLYLMSWQRN